MVDQCPSSLGRTAPKYRPQTQQTEAGQQPFPHCPLALTSADGSSADSRSASSSCSMAQVIWHADHNRQVKVRLDEWNLPG